MRRAPRTLLRLLPLALAAGLAGCHPHAYHPYTATGPQGEDAQAYWRDFSHREEQLTLWREDQARDRAARQSRDLRMIAP